MAPVVHSSPDSLASVLPHRTSRALRAGYAVGLAAALLALGCSGSSRQGDSAGHDSGANLETVATVTPALVGAGTDAQVSCTALRNGNPADDVAMHVETDPRDGIEVDGFVLHTASAGVFTVRCLADAFAAAHITPATLEVVAGAPASVRANVEPAVAAAGEPAQVTCTVLDAFGNEVPAETHVVEQPGIEVDGHTITGTQAGTYKVACGVDAAPDLPSTPAPFEVQPGDPVAIEAWAEPQQDVYDVGDTVHIAWRITDAWGNERDDLSAVVTPPALGVEAASDPDTFVLAAEGVHVFDVAVEEPWQDVATTVELLVDHSPPEIVITWPARGDTVQVDVGEPIKVTGYVTDAAGVASFTVDGVDVPLDADGTFSVPVLPLWGLNVIDARATDNLGNEARISPSFYAARTWLPLPEHADAAATRIDGALSLLPAQSAFDDGDHDPAHPDDLATWVELALGIVDLNALLPPLNLPPLGLDLPGAIDLQFPGPLGTQIAVQGDLSVDVIVGQPQFGPPSVALQTRDGGLDADVGFGQDGAPAFLLPVDVVLTAPVTMTVTIPNPFGQPQQVSFDTVGTATVSSGFQVAHLGVFTSTDIHLDPGGTPTVEVVDATLSVEGAGVAPVTSAIIDFGSIQLPIVGAIPIQFDLVQLAPGIFDLVNNLTLDPIWAAVEPLISGLATPVANFVAHNVIEPLLGALDFTTTLPLPALLGGAGGAIGLSAGLDTLTFEDAGARFGLGTGLSTDKAIDRDPLGMPLRGACLGAGQAPPMPWDWSRDVGIGIRLDALNELLAMLWWNGTLDNLPLDQLLGALGAGGGATGGGLGGLPVEIQGLALHFLLPPIINDCGGDGWELQVGDLGVDLDLSFGGIELKASLYVDASFQLYVEGQSDGLHVVIGDANFLDIEVLSASSLGPLDIGSIIELGLPALLGQVSGQDFGPVALPSVDLSAFIPGLPQGASLQLGNLDAVETDGYLIVGGDLQ